jgi:hypothetical protein
MYAPHVGDVAKTKAAQARAEPARFEETEEAAPTEATRIASTA